MDKVLTYNGVNRKIGSKFAMFCKHEYTNFVGVLDVLSSLRSDEQVTFILRHAERESDWSQAGHLTENGKAQARALGAAIPIAGEIGYYNSTGYTRTLETTQCIHEGRNDGSTFVSTEESYLLDTIYIKNRSLFDAYSNQAGGGWYLLSDWVYRNKYTDAMYDLKTASDAMLQQAKSTVTAKINFMISHDYVLMPLVAYVTDYKLDLDYRYSGNWLTYLNGIAIIVRSGYKDRIIPINGLV